MMLNDFTRCDRSGNSCPSRNECLRYTTPTGCETVVAALNQRREAGATACDMFKGNLQSTFDHAQEV